MKNLVKPFIGLRPHPDHVTQVIAPPYDVVDRLQAKQLAHDNPYSFLHISKPEINLADTIDEHDPQVYACGEQWLQHLRDEGILLRDSQPAYYIYRILSGSHVQTGVLGTLSVAAYRDGKIAKHELTRPAKVSGRVQLTQALQTQISPVLLTYRDQGELETWLANQIQQQPPLYQVTDYQDVTHQLWSIDQPQQRDALDVLLQQIPQLYIADGHHRCACADEVYRQDDRATNAYFLAAMFPASQLQILSYHRLINGIASFDPATFLQQLTAQFGVQRLDSPQPPTQANLPIMYLAGHWYQLQCQLPTVTQDPVAQLPITLLHQQIIEPLLGITDPRVDPRIDFCGGQQPLLEIAHLINQGKAQIFFGVAPTSIDQLLSVADAGALMPPKSTWFAPKLVDGFVSYETFS
ncbi:MAG: DUF1015 family protein [Legionellales bacterium]|nr:DUF1015 family protein [Legionellales bacterium]